MMTLVTTKKGLEILTLIKKRRIYTVGFYEDLEI
jgi:hypothetical protein